MGIGSSRSTTAGSSRLHIPGVAEPALAGMGLNMAVDPAYRGRGLLDTVAAPVHSMITERGCVAGVGFSSTGGLEVTRKEQHVCLRGPWPDGLDAVVLLSRRHYAEPLERERDLAGGPARAPAR